MQIDSVPELPPSGCYENIATSMDVFFCYLFAYPTSKQDAKTIAKVLINIMTKHAYLLMTLISDRDKTFMSHVIREVACVLGITLKHATTKHAQINGLPERCYAAIKQTLRFETGERRILWHKYVSIAIVNYTTSSHASFGCETSRVFPGLTAYNILDLKIRNFPLQNHKWPKMSLNKQKGFSKMSGKIPCKLISNTKRIIIKKTNASKHKQAYNVYVLQPKPDHQGSKIALIDFLWI